MKFLEGKNKFRVLAPATIGFEYWVDEEGKRKPVRHRDFMDVPNEFKGECKHFWAFPVWNYNEGKVQILEITQKGIMATMTVLSLDEEWGNPTGYDIIVTREGSGLETEYSVVPVPHKELEENADISGVNVEALFDGEDPFEAVESKEMSGGDFMEYTK